MDKGISINTFAAALAAVLVEDKSLCEINELVQLLQVLTAAVKTYAVTMK